MYALNPMSMLENGPHIRPLESGLNVRDTEPPKGKTVNSERPGRLYVGDQPRASRTDEAYRVLKSEIMENRMPPGFQCLETELAELLGISRTPIHEAIVRLSQEGLVEVRRRRGMRVLPISVDDMRDIYDLLAILEPEAARLLAETGLTEEQVRQLRRAVDDMEQALEPPDLGAWATADDRFHRLMLEFVPNRRLARIIGQLLDQAHRTRMFTLRFRTLPRRSTEEHGLMVQLLERGESETIAPLYRKHRVTAATELLAILAHHNLPSL